MSPQTRRPSTARRAGFSLVELLMVVAVISVLIALLMPAIGAVRTKARLAQVGVEIKAFEAGITNFKQEYGMAPPSSITLHETPSGWSSTDPETVASKTLIRRLWPQFDFSGQATPGGNGWDINGDGDPPSGSVTLTGAECLVFFLGGVTRGNPSADEWVPIGFSKNPRNPFDRTPGERVGPFTEFDPSRFVNGFNETQLMPEYLDPLPSQIRPYLYASSYDGRGYDLDDLGGQMLNVYTQVEGDEDISTDPLTIGDSAEVPWKQNEYQIISPGLDGQYGIGGLYKTDEMMSPRPNEWDQSADRDNLTNFSSGQLEN